MAFISLVISYLIGSISFSYLIAKKIAGIDIRLHGSGNAGATNTLRVLGKGPAILVLLLDASKGLVAMGIGYLITGGNLTVYALAGACAIIGHNWPAFFGFRGGKGIATTVGVAIGFSPVSFLVAGVITLVVIAVTRYVSLGSLVFVTLLPICLFLFEDAIIFAEVSLLLAVFAYARHYTNILNLLSGKERKLGEPVHRNLR
ncbi:glycerol-3-phosphate 1-O-acyltransferase PlsY [Brevibacillus sp. H7]|jgi:glycerol-3-phosphate acyltransferase PlsY|uniref:glycerol-3-phosphate 1-O-acyltransferase PlsY n=1 Tax=Brevibacillus sp. H7 TaxID=3349138 RepID=UPI00382701FB